MSKLPLQWGILVSDGARSGGFLHSSYRLISVQTGLFQRALDYRVLFKSKVISSVVMLGVSVSLALLGFDYWSMVFGTISSNVFICVFLTVKSSWRPCFFYSFKELGEMFSFSGWTLLETISIWLVSWAGTFIVANTMTQNQVGLYKTATQMELLSWV